MKIIKGIGKFLLNEMAAVYNDEIANQIYSSCDQLSMEYANGVYTVYAKSLYFDEGFGYYNIDSVGRVTRFKKCKRPHPISD